MGRGKHFDLERIQHGRRYMQGNIGATEGGLHFCEEEEIIPSILEIAENSPIPSVRGCVTEYCSRRSYLFYLGLVSMFWV